MENKAIIRKPSPAIQAIPRSPLNNIPPSSYGAVQRKLWNILFYNARNDLTTKEVFSVNIWKLCKMLNLNDIKLVKDYLVSLSNTTVEFNYFKTRDVRVWKWTTLIASGAIEDSELTYSYSPIMREMLTSAKAYTLIDLSIQRLLKSKYSLMIYELCLDHIVSSSGKGFTPFIAIDDLREYLGCKDSDKNAYKNYGELNRTIISRSIQEINQKTDIDVCTLPKRKNKKVHAIQFRASYKPGNKIAPYETPALQQDKPNNTKEMERRLINEYNLTEQQAQELTSTINEDSIKESISYIAAQIEAGKIDNLPAFVYSAIKNGYKGYTPPPPEHLPHIHPGMKIDIGDGKVFEVNEYKFIDTSERSSLPEGMIKQGIKEGIYKVVK